MRSVNLERYLELLASLLSQTRCLLMRCEQLAAMQESLRQLNDLNDEALMESSRTAEKLAAHAGIEAEVD
jgi:hypothetical protein